MGLASLSNKKPILFIKLYFLFKLIFTDVELQAMLLPKFYLLAIKLSIMKVAIFLVQELYFINCLLLEFVLDIYFRLFRNSPFPGKKFQEILNQNK